MSLLGAITFPASLWIWPAGGLLLAVLALLVWSYRRAGRLHAERDTTGPAQKIAFGLKLLGIAALALCLVEPLWSDRRAKSGANLLAVVADNSGGMNILDSDAALSRGAILQNILQTPWLATLLENFQVRRYSFDTRLHRTPDFSNLVFDGRDTALGAALRTLAERFAGKPLAGIFLLTDGCATDLSESWPDLSGLPPVYPVVIGEGGTQRDLAIANVSVSQTSFEDAPVTIQADVEAAGFAGRTVAVDLLQESGNLVERRRWRVGADDEKEVFRFRVRPDKTGVLFYRLQTAEDISAPEDGTPLEATLANNRRTVVVDRPPGPYRILYVAGRPNWEYKFLQRAVSEDEQVQLVGLLRAARREPKYDWRGRSGETSNPLYRGFEVQDREQAGEYDRPVLVRLNTRDQAELRDGFPTTGEVLFDYHAVILDDVEAAFFTRDQMDLLHRFVAERGGGFLMLGGKDSFRQGGFQRTPLGDMLPVYLDPVPGDAAAVHLELTREGWLQPWARLRDNEKEEQRRRAAMPEFRVLNRLRLVRPGARVIATAGVGEKQPLPALVVQRLGNGRTAALAVGDIWRWGLQDSESHNDMDKFWRQTLRWLVADVPERISVQAGLQPDEGSQAMRLRVRVRDRAFEPKDDVSVALEVRDPNGRTVQPTVSPVPTESGVFEATYLPRANGGYLAKAIVIDAAGKPLGEARAGWAADLDAREFQSIRANRPLLEKIARQTGGRIVAAEELDDFARSLPYRKAPVTEVWVRPLWDLPGIEPVLFLFALVCFVGEWALRRWKGMP